MPIDWAVDRVSLNANLLGASGLPVVQDLENFAKFDVNFLQWVALLQDILQCRGSVPSRYKRRPKEALKVRITTRSETDPRQSPSDGSTHSYVWSLHPNCSDRPLPSPVPSQQHRALCFQHEIAKLLTSGSVDVVRFSRCAVYRNVRTCLVVRHLGMVHPRRIQLSDYWVPTRPSRSPSLLMSFTSPNG